MYPKIKSTSFGQITIDKIVYEHDIIIDLVGKVKKRKKKLSKAVYGTSHIVSKEEAKYIYEKGTNQVVIGSGQYGKLDLSDEARAFFEKKNCRVRLKATPEAAEIWNTIDEDGTTALFHITC